MVRDLAAKLRVTAAVLGCASQKDLCARFRDINPGTTFDLDRSYKWMQGRAQPRSARVYQDWATLLGTDRPISYLQSCTIDEFLDLVCDRHKVRRDTLAAQARLAATPPEAVRPEPDNLLLGRRLAGAYACYCPSWSPYSRGKIVRGSLAIEVAPGGRQLIATYSEQVAVGRAELRGPVSILDDAVQIDVFDDAARFRLSMCLFLPGRLASVLAGVISGVALVDVAPQPTAARIVMVRIPGATAAALEATNRYIDATEPLSGDLAALGVPAAMSGGLDALLGDFLAADPPGSYIKVAAAEYSQLTLAIDRLFIDSGAILSGGSNLLGAAVE